MLRALQHTEHDELEKVPNEQMANSGGHRYIQRKDT